MLKNLEIKLDVLGISSISITNSSLEDVFIRYCIFFYNN